MNHSRSHAGRTITRPARPAAKPSQPLQGAASRPQHETIWIEYGTPLVTPTPYDFAAVGL
jgi:hypothetical protein